MALARCTRPRCFRMVASCWSADVMPVANANFGRDLRHACGAFSNVDNELKVSRVRAHLRVLFDGKVQIIGGNDDGSMEIYDPVYEGFGGYAHVLPEGEPVRD